MPPWPPLATLALAVILALACTPAEERAERAQLLVQAGPDIADRLRAMGCLR